MRVNITHTSKEASTHKEDCSTAFQSHAPTSVGTSHYSVSIQVAHECAAAQFSNTNERLCGLPYGVVWLSSSRPARSFILPTAALSPHSGLKSTRCCCAPLLLPHVRMDGHPLHAVSAALLHD